MLDTVTHIINPLGTTGTGFFVARRSSYGSQIFMVTNKHVLSPIKQIPKISFDGHTQRTDGTRLKQRIDIVLNGKNQQRYQEHPDPNIDVAAMNITDIKINNPSMVMKCFDYDKDLATQQDLKTYEIEAGDDVLMVGFPLGITQGTSNGSVLRQAMIASRIGEPLEDQLTGHSRTLPAFLVDGGVVHGSSGSPVILKPVIGRIMSSGIQMGDTPLMLLGILAETRFGRLRTSSGQSVESYAGLGMAFDASAIKQVLELFPKSISSP